MLHETDQKLYPTLLLIDPEQGQAQAWARDYLRKALCLHGTSANDCACQSCHLLRQNLHPDAHFFPEKTKTEDIRQLLHKLTVTPSLSPYHGVFLGQIDEYHESALSALLKTLEEPLMHTIFVLSAKQKRAVKATILSRCQLVNLHVHSHEQALKMLMQQGRMNAQAAEEKLYRHFGNPYAALAESDDAPNPFTHLIELTEFLNIPRHSAYLSHLDQIPDKALLDYLILQVETLIRWKQLDSYAQSWQNFAPLKPEHLEPLNLIALHTLYARLQARRRPNLAQTGQAVNLKSLLIQYHHRNDTL